MATKRSSPKSGKPTKSTKKAAKKSAAQAKRAPATGASPTVSDSFNELLGRALTDKEFRNTLFTNRAQATKGFRLTAVDRDALDRLTPDVLESQAERLGNRAALAIRVVIKKKF